DAKYSIYDAMRPLARVQGCSALDADEGELALFLELFVFDGNGVVSAEAGVAISVTAHRLVEPVDGQVTDAIGGDEVRDLVWCVFAGDELAAIRRIDAVETG